MWQATAMAAASPTGRNPAPADTQAWWERRTVLVLLVALTALPAAATTLPPLIDLYGHLGRYKIELDLASSPWLQRNWDFEWKLVANLGVDLLIIPLSALFGLERAGWIVGVCLPPLLASGFLRTARAVHGHIPATALAALPFALAYPYQYGFVNYWLGLGLAFHIYASWVARRTSDGFANGLPFLLAGLVLWLTHVFAWGILGVLAGCAELVRVWQDGERRLVRLGWRVLARIWPLLGPLPLFIVWRRNGEGAGSSGWFDWDLKLRNLTHVLRDQSAVLDLTSIYAAVFLIYVAWRQPGNTAKRSLTLAAVVFIALIVLFPFELFGSAFADARLSAVLFAVVLLSFAADDRAGRPAAWIAAVAVGFHVVRIAAGTAGFVAYDRDRARHLEALEHVQRGGRIVALVGLDCVRPWRLPRLEHIASLAIVRREAFVNTQWDVPGAQLVVPLAGRGTPFNNDPSQLVLDSGACDKDLRPEIGQRIATIPRARFDYVWIVALDPRTLPSYPGLQQIHAGENSALYRIIK